MNVHKDMRVASRTTEELENAKKALNDAFKEKKSIGEIYADPKFQFEVAALTRQLAVDTFNLSDPTPLFVERRSAAMGDTVEVEEVVNTMKAVRRHPGSLPMAFTPTKRKVALTTSQWDVPFAMDLERILRGQLEASVFVEHAAQAMSRLYVDTVLDAIDAACTGTDHYSRNLRETVATAVDQTTLDAALQSLGDVNSNTFIAGRYYALFPILGFSGFSDIALEEIRTTGLVGRYKGAQVIVLNDDYNWFAGEATIPDDRIYLGGSMKGAWMLERETSALNYQSFDAEKAWLKNGIRLDFGVTVMQPWKYRVVEIT